VSAEPSAQIETGSTGEGWTSAVVAGRRYRRLPVRTRWLTEDDELTDVLLDYLPGRRPGDTVVVSEKVAVLLTGRSVRTDAVVPGRLARTLARSVKPRSGSRGLSVPEKMQYVAQTVGRPRLVAAALSGAVTRPFGLRGMFYRVAGPVARDLDGARPPYEQLLFPPLPVPAATALCESLADAVGVGVAIVDLNDFGGSVRAVSRDALPPEVLRTALADNPLRQRLTGTPIGLVRPA
jgi:F420-0:gamma-glutamyl ligase